MLKKFRLNHYPQGNLKLHDPIALCFTTNFGMFEFKQNLVRNAFSRFSEYTITLMRYTKIEYKKAWLKIESLKGGGGIILFPQIFLSVIAMLINLFYKVKKI